MLVESRAARQVAVVFYGLTLIGGAGPAVAAVLLVPLPGLLAAGLGLLAGAAGTLGLTARFATVGRELQTLLASVGLVWAATAGLVFTAW
ncbi:hypothetical protein DEJ50_31090 [Streptomyces venezuelae]|uniref:Uncharacterized protein n=1 Tax=Streptomyces venezuelae TaxID=54571 RepID=A0A5P2DC05_STRVZ|nr:hypothetical protein [Streptomyces venezuelae]QES51638.1 hypothetical protein DEJ50_31090 [Streptomyces venezuelae]